MELRKEKVVLAVVVLALGAMVYSDLDLGGGSVRRRGGGSKGALDYEQLIAPDVSLSRPDAERRTARCQILTECLSRQAHASAAMPPAVKPELKMGEVAERAKFGSITVG